MNMMMKVVVVVTVMMVVVVVMKIIINIINIIIMAMTTTTNDYTLHPRIAQKATKQPFNRHNRTAPDGWPSRRSRSRQSRAWPSSCT
jgi:hypothetical protein